MTSPVSVEGLSADIPRLRYNLFRDVPVAFVVSYQLPQLALENFCLRLRPQYLEHRPSGYYAEFGVQVFYLFEIDVVGAVQFARIDALYRYRFVCSFSHRY